MWLIVGLGNPGAKYLLTRHNVGFMALDALVFDDASAAKPPWRSEHNSLTLKCKLAHHDVLLVKPQTYMNLSGQAVQSLMAFYKVDLEHLIVLHDDIDQPFAGLKIQRNRGPGGHNGIKSISELLGTQDYLRVKMGVGRPAHPKQDVADFVLQNFAKDEMEQLPDFLERAADATEAVLNLGWEKAATEYNRKAT